MSPMISCLVVLVAVVVVSGQYAQAPDKYTTKYDHINLDDVLPNDRLRKNALSCLLDDTNCTPDVRLLKVHVPDALQTGCARCSERQKEGTRKVFKYLIDNHPDEYKKLAAKYDPSGEYIRRYRAEAAQANIHL